MMPAIVIAAGVVLLLLSGAVWTWIGERREFNRGACRCCGAPWQSYDEDALGGRLYRCAGGHWTWVNWRSVDKAVRS